MHEGQKVRFIKKTNETFHFGNIYTIKSIHNNLCKCNDTLLQLEEFPDGSTQCHRCRIDFEHSYFVSSMFKPLYDLINIKIL